MLVSGLLKSYSQQTASEWVFSKSKKHLLPTHCKYGCRSEEILASTNIPHEPTASSRPCSPSTFWFEDLRISVLLESFIKCVQNMFLTALSTHPFHPLSTSSKHHRPKNVKGFHATSTLVLQHRDFEMEHMGAPTQKNTQYKSFDSPGRAHTAV